MNKFNSDGDLLWVKTYGFPDHVSVVQMPDKSIATAFDDNFVTDHHDYLMSLDSVGNIQNLSIAPDGKILALGYNTTNCVLLCYNSAGTMLWKRDVVLEGFDLLKFNYAIWTSDGGILLKCWIYGDNGYPSFSQIFFLKQDQYGCILPDCAETIITSVENMDATTSTFAVSPNPTGGQINITYKGQDTRSVVGCKVAIYDNSGRLVLDGGFLSGESTVFDLKGWEAGVYHLSISNREARCYYERIIKY